MFRIDNSTAGTILPTPTPPGTPGFFTTGTIGGELATIVSADFMNDVQEELIAILTAAGIAPDKTNNTQVITAILALIANNTRRKLTAATTIYIAPSPTGNDANDGLTPETPLATGQAAWDLALEWDLNLQNVTLQFANGTYTTPILCTGRPIGLGPSNGITILGNTASPSSVVFNVSQANAITATGAAIVTISGVTISATGATDNIGNGINARNGTEGTGGTAFLGPGVVFAHCDNAHMYAVGAGSNIFSNNVPYAITGTATNHLHATDHGYIENNESVVTTTGTPAISVFALATYAGLIESYGVTYTGNSAGSKYYVSTTGMLNTGNNPTNLPGTTPGAVDATTYGVLT